MNVSHIQDIKTLSEFLQKTISQGVIKRLFLVEDVTAPVIELLGSTLRCRPDLFVAHMQHYGNIWRTPIDNTGINLEGPCISCSYRGPPRPVSSFRYQPFFSFPFRRKLRHKIGEGIQHAGKRTMFRDHNDFENTVEERISGALSTTRDTTAAIG